MPLFQFIDYKRLLETFPTSQDCGLEVAELRQRRSLIPVIEYKIIYRVILVDGYYFNNGKVKQL